MKTGNIVEKVVCILIAAAAVGYCYSNSREINVVSGEKITCSVCGRIISDNTEIKRVHAVEADNYKVVEGKSVCLTCQTRRNQDVMAATWHGEGAFGMPITLELWSSGKGCIASGGAAVDLRWEMDGDILVITDQTGAVGRCKVEDGRSFVLRGPDSAVIFTR